MTHLKLYWGVNGKGENVIQGTMSYCHRMFQHEYNLPGNNNLSISVINKGSSPPTLVTNPNLPSIVKCNNVRTNRKIMAHNDDEVDV